MILIGIDIDPYPFDKHHALAMPAISGPPLALKLLLLFVEQIMRAVPTESNPMGTRPVTH